MARPRPQAHPLRLRRDRLPRRHRRRLAGQGDGRHRRAAHHRARPRPEGSPRPVTDRHQLTALAALSSLRQAHAWIPDVADAATIPGQTRQAAIQTHRTIARRGTLYAVELAERRADQRITPAGAHPMPIRPELVGLDDIAERAVVDAAWITSSALRRRPSHLAVTTTGDTSPVWWPRTRL